MVSEVRVLFWKAYASMEVTVLGMVRLVRLLPWKAPSGMAWRLLLMVSEVTWELANEEAPMLVTPEGSTTAPRFKLAKA